MKESSPANTTISHYRILSRLGAGGMGEVYLAEDTQLDRKVAIKLLPPESTADDQAKKRLVREARAAAKLDHPNICSIYEVGEEDGHSFIVMQYLEGETLANLIQHKPLDLRESLDIAAQVADALAEAHAHQIMHRDIKPQNIMITARGQVKVLDFGLAKVVQQRSFADSGAETESLLTEPGMIIGTVPYMSPEQVRGEALDARSDIFSFGTVLYEMVSGRQPFASESAGATFSSILTREPSPLARYSREAPAELERMVMKALRKDREERYQTAKDLLIDLKSLRRQLEFEAAPERPVQPEMSGGGAVTSGRVRAGAETAQAEAARKPRWGGWGVKAALALGALVVLTALWYLLPRPGAGTKEVPASLRNTTFTQLTDQPGPEYFPSLSPDGKSFVYAGYAAGNWDIYLQRVGGKNPVNLTKDSPSDDTQPAVSPDGERIAFRSQREGGGVFVMGATGESVKRLTDFGFNPAWSADGKEIACADESVVQPSGRSNPNSRIWAVNVATGERRLVTKEDSVQPNWSPHGHRIAYWGRPNGAQRDILTIPAGGGEPLPVTNDAATDWNAVWSPDGKYLYFASDRGGSMNLWRVPIEEQTGKVLGQPEAVTTPSAYTGHLSFSHDGRRMAYANVVSRANLQQVGFDPNKETVTGQPVWITQGSRRAMAPDLSPDGEWLAFDSQGGQQEDLFVIRQDGTGLRQLTDDIYKDRKPNWSPDGKRIAFYSDRSGKWEIWTINSDGSGLHQLTYTSGTALNPVWSPDGTLLAYRNAAGSPSIIEVGKPWQEQSPRRLPSMSDSNDWAPCSWSPDGRRLAGGRTPGGAGIVVYSLESQQYEKLTDFGNNPVWLSDSRRLLFLNQGKVYLVDSQSKQIREVLSAAPHDIGFAIALSRDDRLIYFTLVTTEADIWLMTLE
jgi:Tol biopolymer transport system component/predicted Ser/Thr protein kinase